MFQIYSGRNKFNNIKIPDRKERVSFWQPLANLGRHGRHEQFCFCSDSMRLLFSTYSFPPTLFHLLFSAYSFPPTLFHLLFSAYSFPPTLFHLLFSAYSFPPTLFHLLFSENFKRCLLRAGSVINYGPWSGIYYYTWNLERDCSLTATWRRIERLCGFWYTKGP